MSELETASASEYDRERDSAAIAAMSEHQFVERYVRRHSDVDAGDAARDARAIYATAIDQARRAELLVASLRAIGSAGSHAALPVLADDLIQFQEDLPDYQELFGALLDCDCEQCRSIIGAPAYMFDLLNLVQARITDPSGSTIPPGLALLERRPDLATLPLDCANTNDEVPYLDVANSIMAYKIGVALGASGEVRADVESTGLAHLATSRYPFDLPFNQPLERIRSYLEDFDTDLGELYDTFQVPNERVAANPWPVSQATLGLSPETADVLFERVPEPDDDQLLAAAYGRGWDYRLTHATLAFDGRSTFVRVPGDSAWNFGPDQDFSISLWVRASRDQAFESASDRTPFTSIVEFENPDGDGSYPFAVRCVERETTQRSSADGEGEPTVVIEASIYEGDPTAVVSGELIAGDYHYVVFSREGSKLQLAVDGKVVDSTTPKPSGLAGLGGDLWVGAHLGRASFFRGGVGQVRLWNAAIDPAPPGLAETDALDSLVGDWPLDEGSGDAVLSGLVPGEGALVEGAVEWEPSLQDISTFMATTGLSSAHADQLAVLFGKLFVTGAIDFDGYTTYASFEDVEKIDFDDDFSIEFWVRAERPPTEPLVPSATLITKAVAPAPNVETGETAPPSPYPFEISYDASTTTVTATRSDGTAPATTLSCDVDLADGRYHHVAFVRRAGDLHLYVDAEKDTTPDAAGTAANTAPMLVGCAADLGSRFAGQMTRLRVWRRGLTADQVRSVRYTRLTGTEAGLAAYWPLDDGGVSIRDLVAPSMPGTMKCRPTLTFDGETTSIEVGTSFIELAGSANYDFAPDTPFTLAAWVHPLGGGTVLAKSVDGGKGGYSLSVSADGVVTFSRGDTAGGTAIHTPPGAAPFGRWSFVVAQFDKPENEPGQLKLSCNGEAVTPVPSDTDQKVSASPLVIGAIGGGEPADMFQGRISDVQVFEGITDPSTWMFTLPPLDASGLWGLWPLDEGALAVAHNLGPKPPPTSPISGEVSWTTPVSAWSPGGIDQIDRDFLDDVHRFARLADRLGWTPTDLGSALRAIGLTEVTNLTFDALPGLADVARLGDWLGLDPIELIGLWHDLETTGDDGGPLASSQFDRIFNTPIVFPTEDHLADPHAPRYRPYPDENPFFTSHAIQWEPAKGDKLDLAVRTRLLGALEIDNDDLERIVRHVQHKGRGMVQRGTLATVVLDPASEVEVGDVVRLVDGTGAGQARRIERVDPGTGEAAVDRTWDEAPDRSTVYELERGRLQLDVPELSELYRLAAAPRALGLTVQQHLDLLTLFDDASTNDTEPPIVAPALMTFVARAEFVRSLAAAGLTVPQALYITRRIRDHDLDVGFWPDDFDGFLADLAKASASWRLDVSAFHQPSIPPGLVSRIWKQLLDAGITDESGIISKAPTTRMPINGATFTNPADGVRVDHFDAGTDKWAEATVELWMKSTPQSAQYPLATYGTATGPPEFSLALGPSPARGDPAPPFLDRGLWIQINGATTFAPVAIEDGHWHHVAVAWKSALQVSVDGTVVLNQTNITDPSLTSTDGRWWLARGWDETGAPHGTGSFAGTMAAVRVWTTALPVGTIASNMFKVFTKPQDDLVSTWLVKPVAGLDVPDGVGHNHGRLAGNPACGPMPMFTAVKDGRVQYPDGLGKIFTTDSRSTVAQKRSIVDGTCSTVTQHLQAQVGGTLEHLSQLFGATPEMMLEVAAVAARNIEARRPFQHLVSSRDPERQPAPSTEPGPVQLLLHNVDLDGELALLAEIGAVAYFAATLELTVTELRAVVAQPGWFGLPNLATGEITIDRQGLLAIAGFKALTARFDDHSNRLLSYLALPPSTSPGDITPAQVAALEKLTMWTDSSIDRLVDYLREHAAATGSWNTVPDVMILQGCFALSGSLGLSIDGTTHLALLNELRLPPGAHPERSDEWQTYTRAQRALLAAVRAKTTASRWATEYRPILDVLNEHERDVLSAYMLWSLGKQYAELDTMQDLYEFLLVDVNMSGVMEISPLKEALNAAQLYIQRCRSNLEIGAVSQISDTWWSWMSSYRVWQANREVFLYPENYLDPTLRKAATPPYRALEQALMQSDITAEKAADAYVAYFDALNEVANLETVGACSAAVVDPADGRTDDVVFYVGRTRTDPAMFYYRTATLDAVTAEVLEWTPWQALDIKSVATSMSPVYAFNRWFVFWVEQQSKSTGGSSTPQPVVTSASIKYTLQKPGGDWMAPQTLLSDQVIAIDPAPMAITVALGQRAPKPQMLPTLRCWEEVVCQHVPADGARAEGVLVTCGEVLKFAAPGRYVAPSAGTTPDENAYASLLRDAVVRANPLDDPTDTGWVPIVGPLLISEDLTATRVDWVLVDPQPGELGKTVPAICDYGTATEPGEAVAYSELRNIATSLSPFLSLAQIEAMTPVGEWPIDEGAGTLVFPSAGIGGSGAITGQFKWTTDDVFGVSRAVLNLEQPTPNWSDATNVTIPNPTGALTPSGGEDFSIEFDLYVVAVGNRSELILESELIPETGPGYYAFRFWIIPPGGQLHVFRGNFPTGAQAVIESDAAVTPQVYHRVELVGRGGQVSLYLDGALQGTPQPDPRGSAGTNPVVLGSYAGPSWMCLEGVVANLVIRVPSDIVAGPAPVGYWPIDDGSGNTVMSAIGGQNGVISGTAKWSATPDFSLEPARWVLEIDESATPITIDNANMLLTPGPGQDFAVEFWVKYETATATGTLQNLIYNDPCDGQTDYQAFEFWIDEQAHLVAVRGAGGTQASMRSDGPLSTYVYHHVCLVGTNGTLWLYVDGRAQTTSGVADPTGTLAANNIVVGGSTGHEFSGVITDLRIWDDAVSPAVLQAPKLRTSALAIADRPGWMVFDDPQGVFSAVPTSSAPSLSSGLVTVEIPGGTPGSGARMSVSYQVQSGPPPFPTGLRLAGLTSEATRRFAGEMAISGPPGVLSLESQFAHERSFRALLPFPKWVTGVPADTMDFDGAFGEYYWEVFFHIPFLIGDALNTNQRFDDAKTWYEYVFDPIQQPVRSDDWLTHDWPIDEGYGSEIADARSDDRGTLQQAPWWLGARHGFPRGDRPMLEFADGQYVELTKPPVKPGPFSLAAWVMLGEFTLTTDGSNILALESPVFAQVSSDGAGIVFLAGKGSGGPEIQITAAPWLGLSLQSPLQLTQWQWHHLAVTVADDRTTLYIDGVESASTTAPTPTGWFDADATATIGGFDGGAVLGGQIADVRIWNEALSASDVFGEFDRWPSPTARFWRFRPLQGHSLQTLTEMLSNPQAIRAYEDDPFDPYAIAHVRLGAFEKAMVMRYLSNLIAWADNLFIEFTWESIVEASMLYTLVGDLLGPEPVPTGLPKQPAAEDWRSLEGRVPMSQVSSQVVGQTVPRLDTLQLAQLPFAHLRPYFCVPDNKQMLEYWKVVADRLYKIRHGENISGQAEQLALFQPPIDPAQLVAAVGSGAGLAAGVGALDAPVPVHRFTYLIARARTLAQGVAQLGSDLLAALEKGDAEQLAALRETQAAAILDLTTSIRQQEVDQLNQTLAGLQANLAGAQARQQTYQAWLAQGLLPEETISADLMKAALGLQTASIVLKTIAIPVYLVPNIFGLADGGMQFGPSVDAAAGVTELIGSTLSAGGQLAETTAGQIRRAEEWSLELQTATHEIDALTPQIDAMQTQIQTAQANYDLNQTSIEQVVAVQQFLQDKFTNEQLYRWMASRVSSAYFQTYRLALTLAQAAERAFQYEQSTTASIITTTAWDSTRKGLAAGPLLLWDVNRLEEAYRQVDVRRLQIEKTISLRELAPEAFFDLRSGKPSRFQFSERLFDQDFPGHYDRKITTISVSIPMVVGPYQNIHATLTQTRNAVLTRPDPDAATSLLATPGVPDDPTSSSIRVNWNANQHVALSSGANDAGMFQLNFADDRYLPFEDTGAISDWTLEMPMTTNRIDFSALSDVIISLRYTALSDNGLRQAVQPAVTTFTSNLVLSVKQSFPSQWHQLTPGAKGVEITVPTNFFPGYPSMSPQVSPSGSDGPYATGFDIGGAKVKGAAHLAHLPPPGSGKWALDTPWKLTTSAKDLGDILVVVPYSAEPLRS